MKSPTTETLAPIAANDSALAEFLQTQLNADERPKVVLSDFDYTLCFQYHQQAGEQNSQPHVAPEVVSAAHEQNLIVATGRRANHPHLNVLWETGLVKAGQPIIAENGGALVHQDEDGLRIEHLVDSQKVKLVKDAAQAALSQIELPPAHTLQVKEGETSIVTRLRQADGTSASEQAQAWLAEQIDEHVPDEVLAVSSRSSVMIQHESVSKATAFRQYLQKINVAREDICVVGMGDAPNDYQLFHEADIRIGFSEQVTTSVDVLALDGTKSAVTALQTIKKAR